jgi:hypothetical protein
LPAVLREWWWASQEAREPETLPEVLYGWKRAKAVDQVIDLLASWDDLTVEETDVELRSIMASLPPRLVGEVEIAAVRLAWAQLDAAKGAGQ